MQNFDIFSLEDLFFFCILLKVLEQGISSFISLILSIVNLKIISQKFFGPIKLFEVQTFYIHKPPKVIMVGKHKNFMLKAF